MPLDNEFLTYSALDAACTLEIRNGFWADITPTFKPAYDMTIRALPVLMFMMTRGIRVSADGLNQTKLEILNAAAEKQRELNEMCGRELNVNSSKQMQDYFYRELRIPPILGKTKKPTLDDKTLQRLVRGTAARPGLRQAKLVQDIRGLLKLHGTYLDIQFDADGRLRGAFNPRGTKFGRFSSSKTIFDTGMNLQNLPQEFKKFLIPDEGMVFIEWDKRQAEWIGTAYISNDANMLAAVEAGIDVHTHTASLMFHAEHDIIKYDHKLVGQLTDADTIQDIRRADLAIRQAYNDSWPRSMSLRQCGKKSNHGLNYDEGYKGFALINEIPEKEAKRIVDMYHTIYPGIRRWYESVKRQLQRDRTLTNCFGRTVRFLGAWNDKLWKSAYSMLPQSTIVDALNNGLVLTYEDEWLTRELNCDILAQVHDSILTQFRISDLENEETFNEVMRRIKDYTSPDMEYNGKVFKIPTDMKVGLNWGGAHPERNPQGMVEIETYADFMRVLGEWRESRVN